MKRAIKVFVCRVRDRNRRIERRLNLLVILCLVSLLVLGLVTRCSRRSDDVAIAESIAENIIGKTVRS